MGIYTNARGNLIRSAGGSVRVTLVGGVGQGNDGTSLPCAGCFVQAAAGNTEVVRMNLGAAATAILGIDLGRQVAYDGTDEASAAACQPLWFPVSDVAELYFFSTDADANVDILYFT